MNLANSSSIVPPAVPLSERAFPSPRARLLLVEDDLEIARELANDLTDRGYAVQHAATGTQGALEARRGKYDLLIVNVMLPETDGLSVIEGLRRDRIGVPVLVISALGAVHDRVRGLQIGGDDYVTETLRLDGNRGTGGRAAAPPAGNPGNDLASRAAGTRSHYQNRQKGWPRHRIIKQ